MKSNIFKRLTAAMVLAVSACFSAYAADAVYLKADATGKNDGTSWANAYTSVHDAVTAAETAGKPLYAAKGLYTLSDTITLTAELSIYGGFKGESESETIEGRNIEANPTIFSGDKTQDDYWVHYTPSGYTFNYADVTDPADASQNLLLIKDGAVQMPPAFTEEFDGYYIKVKGTNVGSAFIIKYKALIDGVTFTGFNHGDLWSGIVTIKENKVDNVVVNAGSIINDCTFIGNQTAQGCVYANVSNVKVTNTKILYTWGTSRGAGVTVHAGSTMISNCVFLCSSRTGNTSGNIINGCGGTALVKDCVMTRCAIAAAGGHTTSYGGPGNLFSSESGTAAFVDCVMTNCYTATKNDRCIPLVNPGRTKLPLVRCYFANNLVVVKPAEGLTYLVFGQASEDRNEYLAIDSCTFVSNTIKALEVAATSGSYLMALMGNRVNKANFMIVNSTFDNNLVETVDVEGVTPILCRGVSTTSTGLSKNQIALANCTFIGDDNGLYDIVQYGELNSEPLNIINCIFEAKGEVQVNPIYADVPSLINLYSCVVQNKFSTDGGFNYFDLESDKIPLVKVYREEGEPLYSYMPDAKTPKIRTTCDVAVNRTASFCGTTIANSWAFRTRDEGAKWQSLGASIDAVNGSAHNNNILADALGAARPAGEFTRGTTQALTDNGENGATLILRREPFTAGTFSDEAVQSVALGGTTKPVTTATADAEDYQFKGWYDENGELYSNNAELTIATLSETPTILTAKYDTPSVQITFNLNGLGIFESTQRDTITIDCPTLSSFPDIPAYTITEGYYLIPGSFNTPETVPLQAAAYTARIITKDTRIIHVVPASEAPAVQNGESWATAYTDIQTAWNDAALYKGEVWLKKGTYTLENPCAMQDNVVVRGGFDGTETTAEAADPEKNVTIISGDVKGDSYWKGPSDSSYANTPIWKDGEYQYPNPNGDFIQWSTEGNADNDLAYAFTLTRSKLKDVAFDGITFTLFKYAVINIPATERGNLLISRCRFLANNRIGMQEYGAVTIANTILSLVDSEFDGNSTGIFASNSSYAETLYITNCVFSHSTGGGKAASIRLNSKTHAEVTDTVFHNNLCTTEANRASATITCSDSSSVHVFDSVFENNRVMGNGHGNVVLEAGHNHFLRCKFINNTENFNNGNGDRTVSSSIYASGGSVVIENCYFSSNNIILPATHVKAYGAASVLAINGGVTATILNSTMENSSFTDDSASAFVGTITTQSDNAKVSLINSIISGSNFTLASGAKGAEIYSTSKMGVAVVNSVLHNEGADYSPIIFSNTSAKSYIYGSLISGFDLGNVPAGGTITNVVNVTPALSNLYTDDNGTIARRPAGAQYGRLTLPVYGAKASDGITYFYLKDEGNKNYPWFRLGEFVNKNNNDTKLTADAKPIGDAFDHPRSKKLNVPGPLQAANPATIMIVK